MSSLYVMLQIGRADESKAVMIVTDTLLIPCCWKKKMILSLLLQAMQLSLVTCKIILAELFAIYQLYQESLSLGLDFPKTADIIPKYFF